MGLRISRRPFLYSSHLIIEVLDKRKGTGLPIPIFHKAEAAFICAINTFLIVSSLIDCLIAASRSINFCSFLHRLAYDWHMA